MKENKNMTITRNRHKNNYQRFDKVHFTHRRRYYDNVPPHWHDFYELEIVIGKGQTTINDTVFSFEHGALCFITPSCIHSYLFEQSEFDCINFNFGINYLDSENLVSVISQVESSFLELSEEDIAWYSRFVAEYEKDWDKTKPFNRIFTIKILEILIMHAIKYGVSNSFMSLNPSAKVSASIPSAVRYIQKNFRKDIKMKDVAESVWLSEKYFSHLFHEVMGVTFSEYLIDIRLRNACHMLVHANDSVTEIARDSGFNNVKHFQRTFKKHFGVTPLEYRNNNT